MKKSLLICLLSVVCLLLITACGSKDEKQTNMPSQNINETQPLESAGPAQSAAVSPSATPGPSSSSSVVAESSNTVSDKEKQKILDDLSGQLDSVLGSIDNLKNLDDSDLDINSLK